MKMNNEFEATLRRELVQLPKLQKKRARRRSAITIFGIFGLIGAGSVSVATLRPAAEVITMPIATPLVLESTGSQLIKLPLAPSQARYLRVELACFDSKLCGFAEQENVAGTQTPVLFERAALPISNWYDPEDSARITPINTNQGLQIRTDPGAPWRAYLIYTEQLNPQSAQLPNSSSYGDGMLVGIPNSVDFQGQMFIPVVASNGKLGWIHYNALMEAVPGTIKTAFPVLAIDCKTQIGSIDLRNLSNQTRN